MAPGLTHSVKANVLLEAVQTAFRPKEIRENALASKKTKKKTRHAYSQRWSFLNAFSLKISLVAGVLLGIRLMKTRCCACHAGLQP